jgi:hypothetical protein
MPYNYRVKISDWQTRPLQFSQPATFVVVWPVPPACEFRYPKPRAGVCVSTVTIVRPALRSAAK